MTRSSSRVGKTTTPLGLVSVLGVVLVATGACSGGGGSKACTPGASVACVCDDGRSGAQVCNSDGSKLGTCACTTGSAGTSGAAGTGTGTAGTGVSPSGAAGTVGSGGHGGAAGTGAAGTNAIDGGAGTAAAGTSGQTDGGAIDTAPSPDAAAKPDGSPDTAPPSGYTGRFVTVSLEDCVVGPGKADQNPWDPSITGASTIPPKVFSDLAVALGAIDPLAAVVGVLAGPTLNSAITASQKPDVYGTVRLDVGGKIGIEYWLVERGQQMDDSYRPSFPSGSIYQHVPLDADVRIRFNLADADALDDDDAIGIAVINSADLMAALAAQKKYEVKVADQTSDQLVFIGISVLLE